MYLQAIETDNGHQLTWLTLDAASELDGGSHLAFRSHYVSYPQLCGPVGIAWLRRTLDSMYGTWRHEAPSWWCGQQDAYGDRMADTLAELRSLGYAGEVPR